MNRDDLERLVDAELKRLPAPRAPRTLLPRVLQATVQRPRAPWYSRPWLSWPPAARAASVAAVVLLAAALYMFALPAASSGRALALLPDRLANMLLTLGKASAVVRVSWRLLLEPMAFALMAASLALSLGCAALWSVLDRVALGGVSE